MPPGMREQAAELADQIAHQDDRDRGRVAERVERRPQHRVVEGPVAEGAQRAPASRGRARSGPPPRCRRSAPCGLRRSHAARATRPARGSAPGPSRGINNTSPITSPAAAAGTAVSQSEGAGPKTPTASSVPITATATKLIELLIRKKATERRAMRSAGMPPSCRIQAPSARPAGAARGHDRAHRQRRPADLPARAPGHVTAEDRPEHEHVGEAGHQLEGDRERDPSRVCTLQLVSHLAEPRREEDDQDEHAERGDYLERPAQQPPRLELARHA